MLRKLLGEDQLFLIVAEIAQIDIPNELDQMFIEFEVPIAWNNTVEALLPELVLDQRPD